MSKVFYLKQVSFCETSGIINKPLLVSKNEKQLYYIANRLNIISEDDFVVVCAFDYYPKICNNISFLTYEDSDFDWYCFDILDKFYDLEENKELIEKSLLKNKRDKEKKDERGTVSIHKMKINNHIKRKEINNLLFLINSNYMDIEYEKKLKLNGNYWKKVLNDIK